MLTCCALVAFAANSVLCRAALGEQTIDASSFTVIRLLSGIVALAVILNLTSNKNSVATRGSWISALMLFIYAIAFSFSYISLDTGTGALVLFGSVQITMILISLFSGTRLHAAEWLGVFIAFSGFVYLVLPDVTTPTFIGFVLMTMAGIAWGMYTLNGRGSKYPLSDTAYNFLRTAPIVVVLALISLPYIELTTEGIILAILSGAIASGLGYTIWYTALRGLSTTEAAVVQLSVPVIAAAGGVVFVNEAITLRLVIASVLILGGILAVILGRRYYAQVKSG